jgi:uncharacterized Zn-finger protein
MKNFEICYTNSKSVLCEGKEKPFDHPRIYLEIDAQTNQVICPYCSKKFVIQISYS